MAAVLAEEHERLLALLPEDRPVTVLPMTAVGRSEEHLAYPGTLTLSAETLRRVWFDIGASVARAGLRKLLFLNSHGGQIQVMQIVARELRIHHTMFVVACSWFQLGLPEGLIDADEQRFGIHAGDIETSMMLALRPDLVAMDRARDFVPATRRRAETFPGLVGLGAAGFGWQAQDLHPEGAAGNARAATAEKGRAIIDHVAGRLVALLDEVARYPLDGLGQHPPG